MIATVVMALLFFSHALTGRVHKEYQDPYSRVKRVTDTRFGVFSESLQPNALSLYYYGELKQPREYRWESSDHSYRIPRGSFSLVWDKSYVAPVMFLDPEWELEFLKRLPGHAARLKLVLSLFTPRRADGTPEAAAFNNRLNEIESRRVTRIKRWYLDTRGDASVRFEDWWRANAEVFGMGDKPAGGLSPAVAEGAGRKN